MSKIISTIWKLFLFSRKLSEGKKPSVSFPSIDDMINSTSKRWFKVFEHVAISRYCSRQQLKLCKKLNEANT